MTLGSVPLTAWAQQPAPVSAERIEKARKQMEEGQNLYAQKRYMEAAQAFQRAYAAQPFAAFLFNEAVCYEKAGEFERALSTFKRYLTADPNPPDASTLKARIERLEAQIKANRAPDAPPPEETKIPEVMHSLLIFESNPPGAPAQVWQKVDATASAFQSSGENKGWQKVSEGPTPLVATLIPGRYHVVVDHWRAFNRSDDDVDVASGRIVQYRTNLSQGDFMGFLRVTADEIEGAQIYLDDPPPHQKKPWGTTPHGELIPKGSHRLWIEAPGYETYSEEFSIETGQQKTIQATLQRVDYGYLLFDGNARKIRVFINNEEAGVYYSDDGPLKVKVPKGTHQIRAVADEKKTFEGEIEVPAGQAREVHLVLSTRYGRGTAWGASVLSAASLGAGIYLGLRSNSILSNLRADRRAGYLAPDDQRVKEGRTFAILADASFGASLLFAGYATYEFLRDPAPPSIVGLGEPREFDPPTEPPHRVLPSLSSLRFSPILAPGQGAFLLQGAF